MSPPSRASSTISDTTSSFVFAIADIAATVDYALHNIDSPSPQASDDGIPPSRKRPPPRPSPPPKTESPPHLSSTSGPADTSSAPRTKKARTTAATSFAPQLTWLDALDALAASADQFVTSTHTGRAVTGLVFPSLPLLPTTVSTVSTCSSAMTSTPAVSPSCSLDDPDAPSYGWFVCTDADDDVEEGDTPDRRAPSAARMFLPDLKPDRASKRATSPSSGNQELVVQQALAADTIDDVLGDLF